MKLLAKLSRALSEISFRGLSLSKKPSQKAASSSRPSPSVMEYLSAGSASDTGLGLHGSQMKRSHRLRVEGVLRAVMGFPELTHARDSLLR